MASPQLQEAALIVNELVNSLAAEMQHELAQEDRSVRFALHWYSSASGILDDILHKQVTKHEWSCLSGKQAQHGFDAIQIAHCQASVCAS